MIMLVHAHLMVHDGVSDYIPTYLGASGIHVSNQIS